MAQDSGSQEKQGQEVDLDEIEVSIVIIGKNQSTLNQSASFLSRRGWPTTVITNMSQAIEHIADKKPDFVLVSFSHTNRAILKLPDLITQTFNLTCIGFVETMDAASQSRLNSFRLRYKIQGSPSGPNLQRSIRKILAERFNVGQGDDGKSGSGERERAESGGNSVVKIKGANGSQDRNSKVVQEGAAGEGGPRSNSNMTVVKSSGSGVGAGKRGPGYMPNHGEVDENGNPIKGTSSARKSAKGNSLSLFDDEDEDNSSESNSIGGTGKNDGGYGRGGRKKLQDLDLDLDVKDADGNSSTQGSASKGRKGSTALNLDDDGSSGGFDSNGNPIGGSSGRRKLGDTGALGLDDDGGTGLGEGAGGTGVGGRRKKLGELGESTLDGDDGRGEADSKGRAGSSRSRKGTSIFDDEAEDGAGADDGSGIGSQAKSGKRRAGANSALEGDEADDGDTTADASSGRKRPKLSDLGSDALGANGARGDGAGGAGASGRKSGDQSLLGLGDGNAGSLDGANESTQTGRRSLKDLLPGDGQDPGADGLAADAGEGGASGQPNAPTTPDLVASLKKSLFGEDGGDSAEAEEAANAAALAAEASAELSAEALAQMPPASLLERAVDATLKKVCTKSSEDESRPLEHLSKVGVFPIDSPSLAGYLVVGIEPAGNQAEDLLLRNFEAALRDEFKRFRLPAVLEGGFWVHIPTVHFVEWIAGNAQLQMVVPHGLAELGVGFFSMERPLPKPQVSNEAGMFSIGLDDISTDTPINFKAYLHLKKNQKYYLYLRNGRQLQPEQKERLKGRQIKDIYMKGVDVENLRMFLAAAFLRQSIKNSA